MSDSEITVRIDGQEVPLGPSETDDFGLSRTELELVIREELHKRGSLKLRALFSHVCTRIRMRPQGQKQERMLKVFMGVLRGMRDAGRLSFRSGQTALFIQLAHGTVQTPAVGLQDSPDARPPATTAEPAEERRVRVAQSNAHPTKAVKELLDENEVNRYLKLGWTLIKTLRGDTKPNGEPCVKYILVWRHSRRPSYPRPKKPQTGGPMS